MLTSQNIPSDAVEVIVPCKDYSATGAERNGGDAGNEIVVGIHSELLVATEIEEAGGGVVGPGDEGVAGGKELDGVDVRVVANKGVRALACANVPDLGRGITRTADENVLVGIQRQRHDVALVALKCCYLCVRLDIPQYASLISRRRDYLFIIDETTAGEVAGVGVQLPLHSDWIVLRVEIINGAYIIKTTARHEVPCRGVGARHHPRASQRNRVNLISCERIPHNQLTILRCRN